jgi:protein-tyrosine phosphatase
MIDIHNQLLTGLDDGAKSWDMTLEMCRLALEDGITHVVATPHANESYSFDRDRVRGLVSELAGRIEDRLTFSIGCDFHLSFDNIENAIRQPKRYTIAAGPYLLVEFSDYAIPAQIQATFYRLQAVGITAIITHPERNPLLQRSPQRVLDWVAQGSLVQVTASSLTGRWGESTRRTAHWLLEQEAVHVLASDAHDDKNRPPILSAARDVVSNTYGTEVAQRLVLHNPKAIVAGEPLPARERAADARVG